MNKSKPISVRYEEDKLNFVKSRAKLKTVQNVFDFLLNKYWDTFHVDTDNPFAVEEIKKDISHNHIIEFSPPEKKVSKEYNINEWVSQKREIESSEEYDEWLAKLEAAEYLTTKQKQIIKLG